MEHRANVRSETLVKGESVEMTTYNRTEAAGRLGPLGFVFQRYV